MTGATAAAYSAGAAAWNDGPMRVYGPLAEELVGRCPIDLRDCRVLDLGAGTGAVSSAARGARVVAVDDAIGMLLAGRSSRPPSAVGDALALPFRRHAFDAVFAAFSLNHLSDPAAGMREAARVARQYVLTSAHAPDDDHPVKRAVDAALMVEGWSTPGWYRESASTRSRWTVEAARHAIEAAGLVPERVEHARISFPHLTPLELVRWRLGMAQCASFVARHDARAIEARALDLLGAAAPMVRSVIFSVARVG